LSTLVLHLAGDARQLDGDLLQLAQAAQRLDQLLDISAGLGCGGRVGAFDAGDGLF